MSNILATRAQSKAVYRIATPWIVVYFIILIAIMAAFLSRSNELWNSAAGVGTLHLGQHVSNFAISYLIVTASGILGLTVDGPKAMHRVYIMGGLLILANVVYELFIPLLNTRDGIDMLYGIIGTLFGVGFLWLIQRFGLRSID